MTDDAILSFFSSLLVIRLNYWVIIHAYRFFIVVKKISPLQYIQWHKLEHSDIVQVMSQKS